MKICTFQTSQNKYNHDLHFYSLCGSFHSYLMRKKYCFTLWKVLGLFLPDFASHSVYYIGF